MTDLRSSELVGSSPVVDWETELKDITDLAFGYVVPTNNLPFFLEDAFVAARAGGKTYSEKASGLIRDLAREDLAKSSVGENLSIWQDDADPIVASENPLESISAFYLDTKHSGRVLVWAPSQQVGERRGFPSKIIDKKIEFGGDYDSVLNREGLRAMTQVLGMDFESMLNYSRRNLLPQVDRWRTVTSSSDAIARLGIRFPIDFVGKSGFWANPPVQIYLKPTYRREPDHLGLLKARKEGLKLIDSAMEAYDAFANPKA